MLLTTVLFATSLPVCLVSLALGVRAPALPSASFLNGRRAANESYLEALSETQRQVFDYVLDALDENFSPPFFFNSPRYSAWYAVGLLARNGKGDVATASEILKMISFQFTDPNTNWYGTFKDVPSAPDPGDVYPPRLYTSYDTNIGLFVCTSVIIIMEEFQHMLEPSLVTLIKKSMYNAIVGDGYRVGGFNSDGYSAGGLIGDNFYPIYSNPWSVVVYFLVNYPMGSQDTIQFWRQFNCGTYKGVTLYALSLWGYMPKSSTIVKHAKDIIAKTWTSIGMFYNPTLHTLGGPWDRTYGYDMRAYYGILGGQIAGIIGGIEDGNAPLPRPIVGSEHFGDAAANVLTPLIAKCNDPYVPAAALAQLKGLSTSHAYSAQAVSPPWDNPTVPRNYTSWTAPGLSIGAIASDEKVIGGAATNQAAYVPASIIWSTGSQTVWFNMFPTSGTISAAATHTGLTIAYPTSAAFNSTLTSNVMTFLFGGFPHLSLPANFLAVANGTSTGTLPNLRLTLSGNVVSAGTRTLVYGTGSINDLPYYNLTYAFGDLGGAVPQIVIAVEKI
ncbi:hypothetical protein B0H16DRAFT_1772439 [Mycena metata]|uniref:Uncharacterized protein n=1 Tax=Mycena metata TaxID=1033252 RepID=A0AAD7MTU2_9AGAR|nr:hypothetical protein B0H16DRAFT_1772439 [Mycena metata]